MLASLPRQRASQRPVVAVGERPGHPGRPGLRRSWLAAVFACSGILACGGVDPDLKTLNPKQEPNHDFVEVDGEIEDGDAVIVHSEGDSDQAKERDEFIASLKGLTRNEASARSCFFRARAVAYSARDRCLRCIVWVSGFGPRTSIANVFSTECVLLDACGVECGSRAGVRGRAAAEAYAWARMRTVDTKVAHSTAGMWQT